MNITCPVCNQELNESQHAGDRVFKCQDMYCVNIKLTKAYEFISLTVYLNRKDSILICILPKDNKFELRVSQFAIPMAKFSLETFEPEDTIKTMNLTKTLLVFQ